MNNKEIINILKKDIKELKKKGFNDFKIIEGLSLFGYFEVDLMVYITEDINKDISGFNKSVRTIRFKTENSRENFLKECSVLKWLS